MCFHTDEDERHHETYESDEWEENEEFSSDLKPE